MRLRQFQILFQPVLRVPLDWAALEEAEALVDLEVQDSREDMGRLLTPWTVSDTGVYSDTPGTQGRLVTVAEAAEHFTRWPTARRARLERCRAEMAQASRPHEAPVLTLPVYTLGNDRLLLDGATRAVAAYLTRLPVRALLLTLSGPVEERISPLLGRLAPVALPRPRRALDNAWEQYLGLMTEDPALDHAPDPLAEPVPAPRARPEPRVPARAVHRPVSQPVSRRVSRPEARPEVQVERPPVPGMAPVPVSAAVSAGVSSPVSGAVTTAATAATAATAPASTRVSAGVSTAETPRVTPPIISPAPRAPHRSPQLTRVISGLRARRASTPAI